MWRTSRNIILVVIFIALVLVIILPFLANKKFSAARRMEISYRWKRAGAMYKSAIKFMPFRAKYMAEYGNFLVRQSAYHKDEISWLKKAEEFYARALKVNPRWSETWCKLGAVQLQIGQRQDKIYIDKAIESFRRALLNNPKGFYVSYTAGYVAMSAWDLLDDDGKEFVLGRLKYSLSLHPWHGKYIFPHVWNESKDFELLKRITPPNLSANRALYYFIRKNNLWQFRKEQSAIVNFHRQKEEKIEFEHEQKEKQNRIANIKRKAIVVESSISRKDWQGKSDNLRSLYKNGAMLWNGTMYGVIELPEGEIIIQIQARGSQAGNIWPYMIVELDGEEIGETFVSSSERKGYNFKANANGGIKVLSITFPNDGGDIKKGEDRNLYIGNAIILER